ncbi:hypothetical protein KC19_VG150000 [Ceratodon purpureus]|uniref:Uncharacterized protein n=1 Tax=Ceratodon purpureus TaxID=3225 RepID=A0A8T0HQA9_CERPU|nr:hypothetical protein KC19_VG150000 [Ceratodon purpureus]
MSIQSDPAPLLCPPKSQMQPLQKSMKTRSTGKAEALLIRVSVLVDLRAQDLLHEIMRVCAMHTPRGRVRSICHGYIRRKPCASQTLILAMAAKLRLPLQENSLELQQNLSHRCASFPSTILNYMNEENKTSQTCHCT